MLNIAKNYFRVLEAICSLGCELEYRLSFANSYVKKLFFLNACKKILIIKLTK